MSLQTWQETLVSAQVAGTLLNTFTTAVTVLPVGSIVTVPANWWYIGRAMRIRVMGAMSNIVTTPGTVTYSVKVGAVVAWTSGAVQLNATAHTTLPFSLDILLTCRSVGNGTSATLMGQGVLSGIMYTLTAAQVDSVNTGGAFMVPATAPAVGTGFDSTASQTIDFFTGFSISNAGNGVQIQQYIVEALN